MAELSADTYFERAFRGLTYLELGRGAVSQLESPEKKDGVALHADV